MASIDWAKTTARPDENHLSSGILWLKFEVCCKIETWQPFQQMYWFNSSIHSIYSVTWLLCCYCEIYCLFHFNRIRVDLVLNEAAKVYLSGSLFLCALYLMLKVIWKKQTQFIKEKNINRGLFFLAITFVWWKQYKYEIYLKKLTDDDIKRWKKSL